MGYPLHNVKESVEIQCNPEGYPLGFHSISMTFTHFTSGTPCNMWWNHLDVDETLKVHSQLPVMHLLPPELQAIQESTATQWNPEGQEGLR